MNKYKIKVLLISVGLFFSLACHAIKLYVFVSFSLPKVSLHALSVDAKKINAGLHLRGLVNDSFKETVEAIHGVVKQSGWGVTINPEHFTQFNIQQVPSFVLADVEVGGEVTRFDKVVGNVSLDYALESFSKHGELKEAAHKLLRKFREVQHD